MSLTNLIVLVAFFGVWCGFCYMLLARPKTWVNWFLTKPYRAWGIAVSVTDERKLRVKCRILGLILLIGGLVFFVMLVRSGEFRSWCLGGCS